MKKKVVTKILIGVIVIGGGVGIAELLPVVHAFKDAGCNVTSILGGRTAELVILQDEIKEYSDEIYITTDDGSFGEKGMVTDHPVMRALDFFDQILTND